MDAELFRTERSRQRHRALQDVNQCKPLWMMGQPGPRFSGSRFFQVPVFPGPGFSEGIALRDYKKFAYGRLSPFELQKY